MKPPTVLHFAWAAFAACTFAVGYLAATSSVSPVEGGGSGDGISPVAPAIRASGAVEATPFSAARSDAAAGQTLTPEQAREAGFRIVVELASRVVRMRNLCALLDHVSAENWRQVVEGFETGLRAEGEPGGEAYQLLLEHIGAVGGAEAVDDALAPQKDAIAGRAINVLKGWANADPKGAVAWFDKQPPDVQQRFSGHMIAAIARVDPKTALEVTFRPGKKYAVAGTVTAVVNSAVNLVGVKGTEDLFMEMRGRPELADEAKHAVFAKLAEKKLAAAQKSCLSGTKLLQSFDLHFGQPYLRDDASLRIVTQAAKANPDETLAWMDMQIDRLTPQQAKAGYHGLGRELQKLAPQKLAHWLATNPTHPQRDNVMEAASGTLLNAGDLEAAARMAAAIGNEEARARVSGVVEKRVKQKESRR